VVISARNGNLEVLIYFLTAKQRYTIRKKMDIVHIDKCRNEIQEQKEVPVLYTGPFRALVAIDS
jgi:hypothetical protein